MCDFVTIHLHDCQIIRQKKTHLLCYNVAVLVFHLMVLSIPNTASCSPYTQRWAFKV